MTYYWFPDKEKITSPCSGTYNKQEQKKIKTKTHFFLIRSHLLDSYMYPM